MAAPTLPPPRRRGTPYRIGLVCLGNICRSPMADVVLTARFAEAGLDGAVDVVSSGTGDWHVGKPMDRRAAALLTTHGYDASTHRAQQFAAGWFEECDLILAMDTSNHRELTALAEAAGLGSDPGRLRMFREFDPRAQAHDLDVPDPYFGGDDGFDDVLVTITRTCEAIVAAMSREQVS